jgi:hypothetical protein
MADKIVYIIESPNPLDLLENRSEGETLASALRLGNVPHRFFRPANRDMLQRCFTIAMNDVTPSSDPMDPVYWPQFHFSAHGNENGIGLMSGEFLTWEILRELLLDAARTTGHFSPDESDALVEVTLSTCMGAYARKMFDYGSPYPCVGIVGPERKVDWEDSLTAFVAFFHLFNRKRIGLREAVAAMNRASGVTDVFSFHMNPLTTSFV